MLTQSIATHVANKDLDGLKKLLASLEDVELQFAFNDLTDEEQVITFRLLSKAAALTLFDQLDTEHQENLLGSFTNEKTIEFVNELAPDDRVRLLEELPAGVARQLIANLSPAERKITNLLLGYEDETAGRIMTTEFISLRRKMTVEQALQRVREQAAHKETVYTLYVTDSVKRLRGVISLKELILAQPSDVIENVMTKNVIRVQTGTDQEEVARTLQEMDFLALPVVDKEERLVGIVTIDDAVDILEDEATEDILNQAGLAGSESDRSEVLVNGSLWRIWRVRLPFLAVTLIGGLIAAGIMGGFEDALEAVLAAAFFIPLIMDTGGSVGTQSSTVFARGVVLGHISTKKFFKHFVKEIGVGFSIGLIMGSIAGAIAAVWQMLSEDGNPMLGLAVGSALVVVATIASMLGFLVPYILIKCKADQAAGSAPLITTIKDMAGLLIYFSFVYLFIGGVSYHG